MEQQSSGCHNSWTVQVDVGLEVAIGDCDDENGEKKIYAIGRRDRIDRLSRRTVSMSLTTLIKLTSSY